MKYTAHRYEATGKLAVDPSAFLELFVLPDEGAVNDERPEATIVTIRGPLDQYASGWCDSYEAICARVALACESPAPAVLLRIDSPGGAAQGCFEAATRLREICQKAGRPLYAWVEGKACSAAYALACAAQTIALSDTAVVGSIGILATRPDYTAQNMANGVRMAFIASGAHKADGHPDSPLTDVELAETQALVDSMATVFFELVASMRPACTVEKVKALDAKIFHGQAAFDAGLADLSFSLTKMLAYVASGGTTAMATPFETAVESLKEAAKSDDANGAAAKRALACLAPPDDEETEDEEAAEAKSKAAADDDDEEKKAAAAPDAKEAASANALALKAMARVHKLEAKIAQTEERIERDRLLASRDDFDADMLTALGKAPIETVRDMVKTLVRKTGTAAASSSTKVTASSAKAAAQPDVIPTRGAGQGEGTAAHLPPDQKRALDLRMGLVATAPGVKNSEFRLTLGELQPIEPPTPPAR